jgi:hypothetical protein
LIIPKAAAIDILGQKEIHTPHIHSIMTTFTTATTSKPLVVVGSTLAFVGATLLYSGRARLYYSQSKKDNDGGNNNHNENNNSSLSSIIARRSSIKLKPPFPKAVGDMLSTCRLAYLSTIDIEEASPHLSLMRFTHLHDPEDGEVVIMSTNTKTKKFDMLQKQKGVALLVHDFPQQQQAGDHGNDVGLYSITLNGECRIVTEVAKQDRYRRAHLHHNPDYPQFIVGKDIAILRVNVTSARICNINDQVIKWDVADGGGNYSSS